jgi:alcohol dehydrogenase class IV
VSGDFVWRDAGRTVVFRREGLAGAVELLQEHGFAGFELLSTPRALADAARGAAAGIGAAAELAAASEAVHEVPAGAVPDLAADLVDSPGPAPLVALGGGRVIDTAKALAAVTGVTVAAIPTTMSGAEMTAIHRLPAGAEERVSAMVRPTLVIADPELMTGQAEPELRASSMNALAHGADSLYTPFSNPVSELSALRGAELIAAALDQRREARDRSALALGSILCGYAIDSAGFGLHHVVSQTLVRLCGTPHAGTNAAVLPHAAAFLAARAPEPFEDLAAALGSRPADLARRIRELGGEPPGLGELGVDRAALAKAMAAMEARHELSHVPGPLSRQELAELLERAW